MALAAGGRSRLADALVARLARAFGGRSGAQERPPSRPAIPCHAFCTTEATITLFSI